MLKLAKSRANSGESPDFQKNSGKIPGKLKSSYSEYEFKLSDLNRMAKILKLAKQFGSNIKIVHVGVEDGLNTKQLESKAALEKELKSATHQFVDVAPGMTVNAALQQLIESDDSIQLIAMINHDHTFFERLTREPVIKKIAFNTKVPFLVIHLFE